jgi:hypothetical protein
MQYRPSAKYIEQIRNGPRRVVLMLVGVMCFLAWLSFFGPAKDHDPSRALFGIAFTFLIVAGIGFVQVRRLRKIAADLSAVWFELTDEGISVESPAERYVLKYEGIRAVSIYRRLFSAPIGRIVLHSQGGDAVFPSLEKPEEFVVDLKQHLGSEKFHEKRGVLVKYAHWKVEC